MFCSSTCMPKNFFHSIDAFKMIGKLSHEKSVIVFSNQKLQNTISQNPVPFIIDSFEKSIYTNRRYVMHIFLLCLSRVLPLKLELAYWTQQVFFYIKHIDRWMLYCSKAHNVQKRMNGNQVSPKVHQFLLQLWYCHDTTPVQFSIIYSDIHGCNFSKFAVKHENDVTLQLKRKMFEFNLFIFNFIEIHLSLYPDLLIYSTFHFFCGRGEKFVSNIDI